MCSPFCHSFLFSVTTQESSSIQNSQNNFCVSTHHDTPIVLYSGFTCFSLIFSLFLIKLRKTVTILNTHFYLLTRPIMLYRLENLVCECQNRHMCVCASLKMVLVYKMFMLTQGEKNKKNLAILKIPLSSVGRAVSNCNIISHIKIRTYRS